jgi:hypothetical protein
VHFAFSLEDLRGLRAHRGAGERIGLAVQLAALRFLGFVPAELSDAPREVVRHVGEQIGVAAATFTRYAREVDARTRRRHVADVIEHAGWRTCGPSDWSALAGWLIERALEHDTPSILFGQALDQLRAERIVRPGLDRLMRTVSMARADARKEIRRRMDPELTPERCDELDELLVNDPTLGMARLGSPSANSMRSKPTSSVSSCWTRSSMLFSTPTSTTARSAAPSGRLARSDWRTRSAARRSAHPVTAGIWS